MSLSMHHTVSDRGHHDPGLPQRLPRAEHERNVAITEHAAFYRVQRCVLALSESGRLPLLGCLRVRKRVSLAAQSGSGQAFCRIHSPVVSADPSSYAARASPPLHEPPLRPVAVVAGGSQSSVSLACLRFSLPPAIPVLALLSVFNRVSLVCWHPYMPMHHSLGLACPSRNHSGGSALTGPALHLLRACSCRPTPVQRGRPYCVGIPRPGLLVAGGARKAPLFCHGLAVRVGPFESLFNPIQARVNRR
jgi:hypothetical protein